jgi:hypothetical protein
VAGAEQTDPTTAGSAKVRQASEHASMASATKAEIRQALAGVAKPASHCAGSESSFPVSNFRTTEPARPPRAYCLRHEARTESAFRPDEKRPSGSWSVMTEARLC